MMAPIKALGLGACPTLTFYCGKRSATICVVLGLKTSSLYTSEYISGVSGPAAPLRSTVPSTFWDQSPMPDPAIRLHLTVGKLPQGFLTPYTLDIRALTQDLFFEIASRLRDIP